MNDTLQSRMHHFAMLSPDEQLAAIQRLANSGMGDYTIAAATGVSVEQIRKAIGERQSAVPPVSA